MNSKELDESLLHMVKTSMLTMTKMLITQGANVNYQDSTGKSVIWYAVENNKLEQVKILIENKADLNIKYDNTPLLVYAITQGYIEVIELLLNSGCDYTATNKSKKNILHIACDIRSSRMFKMLLRKCPNINIHEFNPMSNFSILSDAIYGKMDTESIQILFDMGADPNIKNKTDTGNTSLIVACIENRVDIVKLFLEHPKIDINIKNNYKDTALDIANNRKLTDIVNLLKNHNSPKKMFNKDGQEHLVPIVKKPLFNIEVYCSEIPVPTLITIAANTKLNCLIWNPAEEKWNPGVIFRDENLTVEVIDGKMCCHKCPEVGFVQFDELTMSDGTVRKSVDLYE